MKLEIEIIQLLQSKEFHISSLKEITDYLLSLNGFDFEITESDILYTLTTLAANGMLTDYEGDLLSRKAFSTYETEKETPVLAKQCSILIGLDFKYKDLESFEFESQAETSFAMGTSYSISKVLRKHLGYTKQI